MECKACGAPLIQKNRGRTPQYCNDRCRKAGQRTRERATQQALIAPESDVTKCAKPVTKSSQASQERLLLIGEWLELGRLMDYRRVILPPVLVDPGVQAWTHHIGERDTSSLKRDVQTMRVYYGHLKDAGLIWERPKEVTGPVCSTVWDGPAYTERHEPDTSEQGSYDPLGKYWCAACADHRELMDLGARLDWPEIYYFPDNRPGLQLTMVRAGAENWYAYVHTRGKDAVRTVSDRASYELKKRVTE